MKLSGVRLCVCLCLSVDIDRQRRPLAAALQHGAQQQIALSSKCEQCHVDSWRRKQLNTDLLKL